MRKSLGIAVATTLAVALTGCSGQGATPQSPSQPGRPAAEGVETAPREPLPAAFDNTAGWLVREGDSGYDSPVVTADSRLVLFRASTTKSSHVEARDARTGRIAWASAPVGIEEGFGSLSLTRKDGKEYAILTAMATEGGNGVDKATTVSRAFVFDTASAGSEVTPLHILTFPGGKAKFTVQDNGVLLAASGNTVTVVDVSDGQETRYPVADPALDAPRPCVLLVGTCNKRNTVEGLTSAGPLVQGYSAFWITGGWFSGDVVPPGASAQEGHDTAEVVAITGDLVLAAWPVKDGTSAARVWALHDGRTGQVVAAVTCQWHEADDPVDVEPVSSPGGRFLTADLTGFDLDRKQGFCFQETASRKQIHFSTVEDDGTAYGQAGRDQAPAAVSLPSGEPAALPANTRIPDRLGRAVAVFGTYTAGGEKILIYPRAAR
ncbi:hypothetical protein ORV05_13460 [Amycolatopsis cynarae]|uniref:PQQ-binding-like beta-propeller repeat protein n=1 Tax=Amycolatopsis cynarae TaxID=2995223 RepID=A0ABY7B8Q5_9PSEU|nr:hypothetical protein [Amycolatopsis sp. HUAS 11-8]WAL68734.1 hypothetical protein ORV05_13460 [Amycolatopsis sp. HUAS 11-8]